MLVQARSAAGPTGDPSERSCRPPPPRCASRSLPRSDTRATRGRSRVEAQLDGLAGVGAEIEPARRSRSICMLERVPEGIVVRGTLAAHMERRRAAAASSRRRRDLGARRRAVRDAPARRRDLQARRRRRSTSSRWSATRSCSSCPLAPLCSADCAGLCVTCGVNRNLTRVRLRHRRARSPLGGACGRSRFDSRFHEECCDGCPEAQDESLARPARASPPTCGSFRARTRCARTAELRKLPHTVCGNCGHYRGRQVLDVE